MDWCWRCIFLIALGTTVHGLSSSSKIMNQRIELFFKDTADLRERVRFLHNSHGYTAFNVVNKNKQDTMKEWVECIRQEVPNADICAHYSLKYNKVARKGIPEHSQLLRNYLQDMQELSQQQPKSDDHNLEHLLISGSGGGDNAWNTVEALHSLHREQHSLTTSMKLAVAYNPYFPDPVDSKQERQRLDNKLSGLSGTSTTGTVVHKVYLQFGTDLVRLKDALEYLTTQQKQHSQLQLAGSVFLPTAKLIAQQKFRPWKGVFLGRDFLSGPETARSIVLEILKLYRAYNVEILWEAPGIRTEKDLLVVEGLMQDLVAASEKNDEERWIIPQKNLQESTPPCLSENGKVQPHNPITPTATNPALVLFGSHDVRLQDNQAIELALREHTTIIPVFLWTPQPQWGVRGALEVVLKDALVSLDSSLQGFGLKLICRDCEDAYGLADLEDLVKTSQAECVFWNREHTPESREMEGQRKTLCAKLGITVKECQSSLLYDPYQIELETGFHGGHWGTLMPFLKNCKKNFGEPRRPTPKFQLTSLLQATCTPDEWPASVAIQDLPMAIVTGKDQWHIPIRERFPMSEEVAHETLALFFEQGLKRYESERSRADKKFATSKLSAHLRIGTISPNELYWRIEDSGLGYNLLKTFGRRLFWRDLAYFQLCCFPKMRSQPIREHYKHMEWVSGEEEHRRLHAWQSGKTGYPIVDAGMRELYATGWMTQSIRMVCASFLTEYLRVSWVHGAEWFHFTLVDADSAINAMMWNNAGKSGIDQWNFVLSPVTASQDPSGAYTRKWLPELAKLPTVSALHRPWEAPCEVLAASGVALGKTYPTRVVSELKTERAKSVASTLAMRRMHPERNTDRGYDMIRLPNGSQTVVFTKKEYRIDDEGNVVAVAITRQNSKKATKRQRTTQKKTSQSPAKRPSSYK